MSFVIIRGERLALELGETILGGGGEGALAVGALAHLPPFAVIDYPVDGESTVRALGPLAPTLNAVPLGRSPEPLRHGDRIEVGDLVIAYGEMQTAGRTKHRTGAAAGEAPLGSLAQSEPTAASGGRLVRLRDGTVHGVPEGGLSIGRDPDSGIPLASKDVSRTHAAIAPTLLGYTLTDQSANGVWVNGARVEGACVLGQGDVIRIGTEDFRFEADAASFEPAVRPEEHPLPAAAPVPGSRAGANGATLLASIEVLSDGTLKGARFRIERPTAQLGRGPQNDVQLQDASVSGSHASLVLRGRTWHVLDLESRNGTFVEGEAVKGQRVLPNVCELRLGSLTLLFRAIGAVEDKSTIGVIGLTGGQLRRR